MKKTKGKPLAAKESPVQRALRLVGKKLVPRVKQSGKAYSRKSRSSSKGLEF